MKALPLVLAALLLAGCVRSSKTPVVVYSPHGKEMLSEFARLYEARHPDQVVRWMDMGSQDAYDRIRTERENPQADVWWGAPMLTFARAEEEGLLEKYVPTWDTAVAPDRKSPQGFWYGTFLTPEVILYNSDLVPAAQAPGDWDDLLKPEWQDKLAFRYPIASGTMRTIFGAIIQREAARTGDADAGFRWLLRLDGNTKSYVADPTQLYLKIARGEALVTLWDLPDVLTIGRTYGYPFGYTIPRSGTPLITDCIAVVKGSKHPLQAREFYEFVTTVASLRIQAERYYRIPARSDLAAADLPAWLTELRLVPMTVDWHDLANREKEWMKRWDNEVKGRGRSSP
jgi:iron(III) transport system substrate-binding protein